MNKNLTNVLSFKEKQNDKLFEEADSYYEKGEFEKAFNLLLEASENGDDASMQNLATMYCSGEGVKKDLDKAIEWERRAIDAGNETAMYNLGITYRMKGDIQNSKKWFEKSYKSGDGYAAFELARLYSVSQKETETVKFYLHKALESEDLFEEDIELANSLLSEL